MPFIYQLKRDKVMAALLSADMFLAVLHRFDKCTISVEWCA